MRIRSVLVAAGHICLLTLTLPAQASIRFTPDSLELSDEDGKSWHSLQLQPAINPTTYIQCAARNPAKPSQIVIGTSFQGIYESMDKGKTWTLLSKSRGMAALRQGNGFCNEIEAIAYADDGSGDILLREGFGGPSWRYRRSRDLLEPLSPATVIGDPTSPTKLFPDFLPTAEHNNSKEERAQRRELAANKRAFYLNPQAASGKNLDRHLDFASRNGLNAIVVDFKDDQGQLTYPSTVPLALAAKASLPRVDVPALIRKAHARNLWVIGRIVVFKDRALYRHDPSLALWDRVRKQPWGVFRDGIQIEYWVDPFADKVHRYNIDLAKEIAAMGVDEIQFDYIRFPSDGYTANIQARHYLGPDGKPAMTIASRDRVRALSGFLAKARSAISKPISTDVYGFNGWARMSYLGQDIQAFARYVDVISPMAYPSHYDLSFLPGMRFFDRAEFIQSEGTRRSRLIVGDAVLIRPYVQAFLLGAERDFSWAQVYEYLNRQVKGTKAGGSSGFALWNNMGNYYMVHPTAFKALTGG